MAQPEEPSLLSPFGDEGQGPDNWFRKAFVFDRAAVLKWMEDVASGSNPNCPPQHLRTDDHFELLLQTFRQLESLAALKGANFVEPEPSCHFYRENDPLWGNKKGQDKKRPQFMIKTWANDYEGGPDARNIEMEYWCIYDLVGLFFGLLGSAPLAADKNNFFLPLTAVFARWCTRLAGKLDNNPVPDTGVGEVPPMFQCTWCEREDGSGQWFFLGAATAGSKWEKNEPSRQWRMTVRRRRFDLLIAQQKVIMVSEDEFYRTEPEITTAGGNGQPWGNCAETLPFVHGFIPSLEPKGLTVKGLALSKKFLDLKVPVLQYSGYYDGDIWKSVVGPCFNCRGLIKNSPAKEEDFESWFESDKATWKNPPAPPEEPEVEAAEVSVIRDVKEPDLLAQEMVEVISN